MSGDKRVEGVVFGVVADHYLGRFSRSKGVCHPKRLASDHERGLV